MKVEILPVYDDDLECYQSIIVSLCKYLRCDYKLMFAGTWRFDYDTECKKNNIGGRLIQRGGKSFLTFLEQFHGIKTIKKKLNQIRI